jgi:mono/diheme cytochrome c family protein
MRAKHRQDWFKPLVIGAIALLALAGCAQGETGATGPAGADGTSASAFGTVSGAITDFYANKVAGATISATVGGDQLSAVADADGLYSLSLPPGTRTLNVAATGYAAYSQSVEAVPAKTVTFNCRLNPNGAAAVTAVRSDTTPAVPGAKLGLQARTLLFATELRGLTPSYKWTQVSGPPATFDDDASATPKVTLASRAAFKNHLIENFATPFYKVNGDEPLVNIDRYQVVPISYDAALTKGNTTVLRVTSTVGGKTFTRTLSLSATIPAVPSSGLASVPINQPVVLQGQFPFKKADGSGYLFPQKSTWSWAIAGPGGTSVQVNDAATPYPDFTPAVTGEYVVSEGGTERLRINAGPYVGALSANLVPDVNCGTCHQANGFALDAFTPWLKSGHASVIFAGIGEALPDGHYAGTCTPCHTVGQGGTGAGGFADQASAEKVDYSALQGDANAAADFWSLYPKSAKLAGVQCETCHGPQEPRHWDSPLGAAQTSRLSFSSNVCATCHARAPRHGRFPQWAQSGHASFATFTFNSNETDGTLSNGCACCHSAQGFKAFAAALPTANGDRSKTVLPADLRLTNAQPITCSSCHVSHDEGEGSKVEWTQLRKVGPAEGATYMLPSGFAAAGVGKGALCIACHNSRQGISGGKPFLHEDGDAKFATLTSYGAPHEAAQGDVLLGRNAYWLGSDRYNSARTRSKHSYISDTCVTCHMELTTLDPALSVEGQTRHDFKATADVCNKCHTAYSTESLQAAFDPELQQLKEAAGTAILLLKYDGAANVPPGAKAVLVANRSGQVDVTTVTSGVATTRRWFIGDKPGQDAFLSDPNHGGALVQGCTMVDAISANCDGFLKGAPGVTAIGSSATQDATVTATGFNGVIAKALWNAVLVQDDASRGVHNPAFTFEVMDATAGHVASFTK